MKRFLFAAVVAVVLSLTAGGGRADAEMFCEACSSTSGDGWTITYCWWAPC